MKKWKLAFRNVKIEEPGKENELCPVCGLPLNSCICGDEPVNPPEIIDPPVEYCDICGKPLSECEGHSSSDHGTGYCAECINEEIDENPSDDPVESSYYYNGNLESHGHEELEVYDYRYIVLKFENANSNYVTINNLKLSLGSANETIISLKDYDNWPNDGKTSIYDFTWQYKTLIFVPDANDPDTGQVEIRPYISYDKNRKTWLLIFEKKSDKSIFYEVILGNGKTPLGKTVKLQEGSVTTMIAFSTE